ncbi:hypothetical protein ACJX0J_018629, partial [Zea mays]
RKIVEKGLKSKIVEILIKKNYPKNFKHLILNIINFFFKICLYINYIILNNFTLLRDNFEQPTRNVITLLTATNSIRSQHLCCIFIILVTTKDQGGHDFLAQTKLEKC